jgi:hypothetical protein
MVKRFLYIKSILFLVVMLAAVVVSGQALAANITVKVDRNPVRMDESFHLTYEADSNVDDPDFSVLNKDFEILNSSQSTNMRMVNGSWSLKKSWNLALMSKKSGVVTVPPVPFGNETSPALRITVNKSSSGPQKPGDPGASIYMEVETNVKQAWVQSEIIYTIRLYSNIPVGQPTLSQPTTDNADTIFFKLGGVKNYDVFRRGERYAVSELKFAAFAQHSGELTFKPVLFQGLISNNRAPQSFFDTFMQQQGTMKRLRSDPVTVKINPVPAGQDVSKWLPAQDVTLVEQWSDDIANLKAGEPVTRTISLVAKGLTAEQLPDIKMADIPGLQQYADQPTLKNDKNETGVTGSRTMKTALIPSHSGDYTLPAVSVSWWNTATGKTETATLPEHVLHVTGVANTLANPPPATTAQPNTNAPATNASAPSIAPLKIVDTLSIDHWRWLSIGLGCGWLLTTLVLVFWRRRRSPATTGKQRSLSRLASEVLKQCATSQPAQTRLALLDWANARWPSTHIANLADVAQHCHAELGEAIRELSVALYSASPQAWQGQRLADAFNKYRDSAPSDRAQNPADSLEPLYK